jgi:hypothetical protein
MRQLVRVSLTATIALALTHFALSGNAAHASVIFRLTGTVISADQSAHIEVGEAVTGLVALSDRSLLSSPAEPGIGEVTLERSYRFAMGPVPDRSAGQLGLGV